MPVATYAACQAKMAAGECADRFKCCPCKRCDTERRSRGYLVAIPCPSCGFLVWIRRCATYVCHRLTDGHCLCCTLSTGGHFDNGTREHELELKTRQLNDLAQQSHRAD